MDILIKNIKGLVQVREGSVRAVAGTDMAYLPILADAYLAVKDGLIAAYGPMSDLGPGNAVKPAKARSSSDFIPLASAITQIIDATDRFVFPSFVDSHTHLVFAAPRDEEFVMKLKGASYADIASRGGGILNSARRLQAMSEDELYERSLVRANEIISTGTGAVEIKSGYGLTTSDEIKMLRVARRIGQHTPLTVRTTFLGAHAIPGHTSREQYIERVIKEMIPEIAAQKLADYIDVFCEEGFFSPDDTERIVIAGRNAGMPARIHANQLHRSGGVQVGVKTGAISVDHLENIGEEEIALLKNSNVMPTALPGAAFFLNLPFTPARKLIDAGCPLAIASDYNPGSAPSGNMPLAIALACIKMRMLPEEAINAATVNTACALQLQETHGSIGIGKVANLFITLPIPSVAYIAYAFGSRVVDKIILNGKVIID